MNTHYWFDPDRDVAEVIMTQTLPFVEPQFLAVYEQFERAVLRGHLTDVSSPPVGALWRGTAGPVPTG